MIEPRIWTVWAPAARRLIGLLTCLVVIATAAGCDRLGTSKSSADDETEDEEETSDKKKKSGDDEDEEENDNDGRFKYKVEKATQPQYKVAEKLFRDDRFSGVVKAMGVFALPRDVLVTTADEGPCEVPNAFYVRDKHAIVLCYPMAMAAFENFVAMGKSETEAANLTRDAMTFVLLHEMGHALISELELGVTGKEEDAVDELATLILINAGKHDMAIAGTYALVLLNHFQGKGQRTPFFDEHSVSEARLYDVFCMILGSDPKRFAEEILTDRPELRRRAPKCPGTYEKIDKAWTGLLAPHRRKDK